MKQQGDHRQQSELEALVRFEALLADVSARLINLSPEQVDAELEGAQKQICASLGFDHSSLWQSEEGVPDDCILTHVYRPPGGPPIPDRMETKAGSPEGRRNTASCVPFRAPTQTALPQLVH